MGWWHFSDNSRLDFFLLSRLSFGISNCSLKWDYLIFGDEFEDLIALMRLKSIEWKLVILLLSLKDNKYINWILYGTISMHLVCRRNFQKIQQRNQQNLLSKQPKLKGHLWNKYSQWWTEEDLLPIFQNFKEIFTIAHSYVFSFFVCIYISGYVTE